MALAPQLAEYMRVNDGVYSAAISIWRSHVHAMAVSRNAEDRNFFSAWKHLRLDGSLPPSFNRAATVARRSADTGRTTGMGTRYHIACYSIRAMPNTLISSDCPFGVIATARLPSM